MNKITLYLFTILFLFSSADLCAKQKKKGKKYQTVRCGIKSCIEWQHQY